MNYIHGVNLSNVRLNQFRNLAAAEVQLSPKANLIFGSNGAGKSNLLEAIYYLCTAKSFRGASDDEMKARDAEFFRLEGEGEAAGQSVRIEIAYKPGEKKRLKINDVAEPRVSSLYEQFRVVSFGPDDVELVYGAPSVRRRFLDISIAQIEPLYISLLWEYKKTLAQRNALLRDLGEAYESLGAIEYEESLEVWDEKLASVGLAVHDARRRFLRSVSDLASGYHQSLTNMDGDFVMEYSISPRLDDYSQCAFTEKLKSRRRRELMMRQSMYGPHRDDITFSIGRSDCRSFASRGQVKTATLALKLAVVEHIGNVCGEPPILLLDEIYSDFDRARLDAVSGLLSSMSQVLVTTSKLEEARDLTIFDNILIVESGKVALHGTHL